MNLHCTTTHDTTHTLLHEVRFLNAQTLGHVHSKAHYCWLGLANEILYRSSLLSHAPFCTIPTLQASDHAWEGFTLFSALGRCNSSWGYKTHKLKGSDSVLLLYGGDPVSNKVYTKTNWCEALQSVDQIVLIAHYHIVQIHPRHVYTMGVV